jgi:hypothetical protein
MKNNQETLLHFMKQHMLAEHIHSVASPLKIDEKIFLELMDDDAKLKATKGIENKLLVDLKSKKYEALIQMIANLTWKSEALMHVSVAMAQKIERDRESTLKLLDRELIYENTKSSNRKAGANKRNEKHEIVLKKIAKEKWQEHRKSTGKPCGATTLIRLLVGEPGIDDLSEDTVKGWTQQWNKELKKG